MHKSAISIFCIPLLFVASAHANELEARQAFVQAVSGVLSFRNERMIDEIGSGMSRFTENGRNNLISELGRSGILLQATSKNGSLITEVPLNSVIATRTVGNSGGEMYRVSATASVQWRRCISSTCVPVGNPVNARVSGLLVASPMASGVAFKVDSFNIDGAIQ